MRLTDIIGLAQQYLVFGIILAAVLGAAAAAGYFLVYKKLMKGKKRVRPLQVLWAVVTLCYLAVLFCATLLDRYAGESWWSVRGILPLFYSYRDAWNSFTGTAWRNIVLNILLFVPLGFLLPLGLKRFRRFWATYLAGLLCTVFIEAMQLFLRRGVSEMDDIFNNFLGTMIGYGCFAFVRSIRRCMSGKKADALRVTALQIPLVATVLMFLGIAVLYNRQELGNLTSSWIVRQDMEGVEVRTSVSYSGEEGVAPVYRLTVMTREETRKFAEDFFSALGQTFDESRIDLYDNTAFYWSNEGSSLTMEYSGKTWNYTDYDLSFSADGAVKPSSGASEPEIRAALQQYGTEPPENAVFADEGEGWYSFTAEQCGDSEGMKDGVLRCLYFGERGFGDITNQIIECGYYKDFPIIPAAEAYEMIQNGEFSGGTGGMDTFTLGDAALTYQVDSKGFYQPVWFFPMEGGEEGAGIAIPAIF